MELRTEGRNEGTWMDEEGVKSNTYIHERIWDGMDERMSE